MKFRLHWEGPLYSSSGEARNGQTDRRAGHKHELRRAFHKQLKHWWEISPFLATTQGGYDLLGIPLPDNSPKLIKDQPLLKEVLAEHHNIGGRRFVPLVCAEFSLLCKLDILLLRRDRPGGIIEARDIDNRLKTLFDALRMPKNGLELAGCDFADDEDPMYVLLQDDCLISTVSVETDELLDPPPHAGSDDGFVRLLVTVDIRPYQTTMFNLSFG